MRRLTAKEVAICVAGGVLIGFGFRPRYARWPPSFLPADELAPAVLCMVAGAVVVLGLYVLLVRLKGW